MSLTIIDMRLWPTPEKTLLSSDSME